MSVSQTGDWIVRDSTRDNERMVESRSEAESKKSDMVTLGANPEDIEIIPPDEADDEKVNAEVIDHTDTGTEPESEQEGTVQEHTVETPENDVELPEQPPVDTDPLTWIPDEFQDTIDGTVAINRKGFEVLAHHYNISCKPEMVECTDERVVHKAVAITEDGIQYAAYGEAHESDCDSNQLVRMSDTRAYKRAVSRATGIGMVAVEELKDNL